MKFDDVKLEVISTVILFVVVTFVLPALGIIEYNVPWFAGIIVSVMGCMLVGIKTYLHKQKEDFTNSISKITTVFSENTGSMVSSMFDRLFIMKEPELSYARKVISDASKKIEKISEGIISLTESEYFDKIISEIEELPKGETVLAVNIFDEKRFKHDEREKQYFNKNIEAVRNRNVIINRIFIYDNMQVDTNARAERLAAIKMNCDAGIRTFIVYKSEIKGKENANELCKDAVMFGDSSPHLYIDYPDIFDETRVAYGELITNNSDVNKFKENFTTLRRMAISDEDKSRLLRGL